MAVKAQNKENAVASKATKRQKTESVYTFSVDHSPVQVQVLSSQGVNELVTFSARKQTLVRTRTFIPTYGTSKPKVATMRASTVEHTHTCIARWSR